MKSNYIESLNEEEKFALLFGILAGDGCLSKHINKKDRAFHFISITGNYYDDKPFFKTVVVPLINSLRKTKKETPVRERSNYGKIEINFCDKELFNKMNKLGFPIGKKGQQLIIPQTFYEKELVKYVVQGFFATDGSLVLTKNPNKFYPRIEGTGISKNLISQVCDYLKEVGMIGYFYKAKRNKIDDKWGIRQQQYRFQFNGKSNLLLFNELVGFINPKHKQKFLDFIEYDREYNNLMKGVPTSNQKYLRPSLNESFKNKMATLGVEPRTPSS